MQLNFLSKFFLIDRKFYNLFNLIWNISNEIIICIALSISLILLNKPSSILSLTTWFYRPENIFSIVKTASNTLDYNIILINFIIITIIASLLLIVNYFLRQNNNNWELNIHKYTAYEGEFEPFSETQSNVFEIQFFLVSIMFLIFDIELVSMLPWGVYFNFLNKFAFWIMILFIINSCIFSRMEKRSIKLKWYKK